MCAGSMSFSGAGSRAASHCTPLGVTVVTL
jgi:hypothetical protein